MLKRTSAAALVALAAVALFAPADESAGVQAQLDRIKKVGREGKGNVEAAAAWKALVAKGKPALFPILDAMNDDDLTSANWLRPAFEAIAEKAGELPKADLEKYVLDTKKPGSARRLAYEWLVKQDKDAPARLLPGMLRDPSHELRRDAVELAIKQADELADKDDKKANA